jgi:allophanate hydrolase
MRARRVEAIGTKSVDSTGIVVLAVPVPFIAERWVTYGPTLQAHPEAVHPVVASAIAKAREHSAADTFAAQYRLKDLQALTGRLLAGLDCLVVPTVGTLYTLDEVDADPWTLNTRMGHYTYFANPLRLAAISVPAGLRSDGLPFGLSLVGPSFSEARLGAIARTVQARLGGRLGATATHFQEITA